MSDGDETRRFLRFVVMASIVASGAAEFVVQGERGLRPYIVASMLDRSRMELANEVTKYGAAVQTLHERVRAEAAP